MKAKMTYEEGILHKHVTIKIGKRVVMTCVPEKTALEICEKYNGYDEMKKIIERIVEYFRSDKGLFPNGTLNKICDDAEQALKVRT